ncbi:DUF2092 domain-containing protein [Streptomyces hoynatensis]|uniref:DUF2092 domain-containing protein n=1 Tax=Streptomyces hoynatensis TaxID=1141874 RepID=A0A3A9YTX6_9ACTN|nr:DUF2092 domain-containing protein [Streptomyces hoynatensis]
MPTVVLAGLAAVGVGVWPALASDGGPDLPDVSAEDLLVRMAESDAEQLSGTVRVQTDLGLPEWGGMLDGVLDGLDGPAGRLAGLATGDGTLQVAMDGPERQRVSLVDGSEELTVIHDGDRLWLYDSEEGTVYRSELPEEAAEGEASPEAPGDLTPREAAQRLLDAAGEHADISVDGTARVAGRSAYQLVVRPAGEDAPLERLRISVDGETGVPLALTADGPGGRSVDVAFTQIDYAKPAGAVFDFTPPSGAEVRDLDPQALLGGLLPEGVELPGGEGTDETWLPDPEEFEGLDELEGDMLEGLERLEDVPELQGLAEHLTGLLDEAAAASGDRA